MNQWTEDRARFSGDVHVSFTYNSRMVTIRLTGAVVYSKEKDSGKQANVV